MWVSTLRINFAYRCKNNSGCEGAYRNQDFFLLEVTNELLQISWGDSRTVGFQPAQGTGLSVCRRRQ